MTGRIESSLQRVTDPVAVKLLRRERVRRVLSCFLITKSTVAVVARQLDIDFRVVYRDVQALLAAGLLTQAHQERRSGRAVRHYQAAAPAFFVPFSASAAVDLADWHRAPNTELDALFHRAAEREFERALLEDGGRREWGQRLYAGPDGPQTDECYYDAELREALSGWQGPPAFMLQGMPAFQLTDAQAQNVQRRLIELMMELRILEAQNLRPGLGRPFLLRVGLAPLTAEEGASFLPLVTPATRTPAVSESPPVASE